MYAKIDEVLVKEPRGDIAQLARAPALQAGGPGFESLYLHQDIVSKFDAVSWSTSKWIKHILYGVNQASVWITPPNFHGYEGD